MRLVVVEKSSVVIIVVIVVVARWQIMARGIMRYESRDTMQIVIQIGHAS